MIASQSIAEECIQRETKKRKRQRLHVDGLGSRLGHTSSEKSHVHGHLVTVPGNSLTAKATWTALLDWKVEPFWGHYSF
jgi:uncharacterized Ntn-hydrolase superfamily protein